MIEKVILDYLTGYFADRQEDVIVLMEAPQVPSDDFPVFPDNIVLIERLGGSKSNKLSHASIALQSYGATLYDAVRRDAEVRYAMENAPAEVTALGRVALNSCYNFTDTRTGRYRYQSIYEIYYMEEALL